MNATTLRKFAILAGSLVLGLAAFNLRPAAAAAPAISQIPLFVTTQVPPNIVLTLDNSGSMAWAYVPDALGGSGSGVVYDPNTPTATTTTTKQCIDWSKKHWYQDSDGDWHYGRTCDEYGDVTTTTYGAPYQPGWLTTDDVYIPDTYHFKSAAFNPLYYDPTVTYSLPNGDDGKTPLSTSFTKAWINGFDQSRGYVDLSSGYEATVEYNPRNTTQTEVNSCNYFDAAFNSDGTLDYVSCNDRHNAGVAFYYTYDNRDASGNCADGEAPSLTDDSCYTKHVIDSTEITDSTKLAAAQQNFAIWFSFYRTRNLTTVSGANLAFSDLDQTYRVAWQDLPNSSSLTGSGSGHCYGFHSSGCDDWTYSSSYDNRIGTFTDNSASTQKTHRTDFFKWLARLPASGGTPLRKALEEAGQYYQTSGVNSPYAWDPQNTDSPELICRPNYSILMTDGMWNTYYSLDNNYGNLDNSTFALPDATTYSPAAPFDDGTSNTLADVAFYYWSHDLYTGTTGKHITSALQYMPYNQSVTVTDSAGKTASLAPYWNPQNDPASWPHMVTFTVGLGMTSTLTVPPVWDGSTYAGGYTDLVTGNASWPSVSSDSSNNVWDLWHAAINGRGQFFSADHPQDVVS
ncbi:MAG TPA: hypothetical protein VFM15_02560, partial [Gammaproteobacteria bacterium]|nr:hypothetical protein [Gammaproteobacteria bacterium]